MKLCVDNLPCSITSARLRKLCSQFGTVESATVHFDPNTGRSRGYGLVDFNEASWRTALLRLNSYTLDSYSLRTKIACD